MRYADSKATEASVRADFEREFTKAREFFERNAYQRVTPNFTLGSEAQWVVVGDTSPEFMNARDSDLKRVTQDIVSQIPRQNLDLFDYIFIVEASGTAGPSSARRDIYAVRCDKSPSLRFATVRKVRLRRLTRSTLMPVCASNLRGLI